MATPSPQHAPQFVVKRKRKRPTYIDPCLGFYALPQSDDPFVPFLDAPKETDLNRFQSQSHDVDLPRIETLPAEENSVGGSDDSVEIQSPKQAAEINVDSFLRSFNKEIPKPYPTYRHLKVKKLLTSTSTIDELEPPLPPKRSPQRVSSSTPPSDEPVDQLFSDDDVTRKKMPVKSSKRQRKVSFAQRLLQAAIVSEVDPDDTLLDVVKPPLRFMDTNSNQTETQRSKRRRCSLIDPRKRDCRRTELSQSFFSSSSANGDRRLPLTRWPTQVSTRSDGEDWVPEGRTIRERLKPMAGVKRRKMSTSTNPQTQSSLLFIPLQEAENGWNARKKGTDHMLSKQSSGLGVKSNPLGLTMISTHPKPTQLDDAIEPAQPVTVIQSLLQPISTAMNSIAPADDQEYEHSISTFAPATMLNTVPSPTLSPKISTAMKDNYSSSNKLNGNDGTQVRVPSPVMVPFPRVNSSEDQIILAAPAPASLPLIPQRPLSSFFDEFFKTAKDVNQLTESVKRPRRERQQPSPPSPSRCLNTEFTEPLFGELKFFPHVEPEPEVDVLETIKSRSCSQYDIVLFSSPLCVPGPEHKEMKRPNTGVRRSMAGLRVFYDVGL